MGQPDRSAATDEFWFGGLKTKIWCDKGQVLERIFDQGRPSAIARVGGGGVTDAFWADCRVSRPMENQRLCSLFENSLPESSKVI